MRLRSTVDVVRREARGGWVVEGGNGRTAVLGVCSVHESRAAALERATRLGEEHDVEVRVLGGTDSDWPFFGRYGVDSLPGRRDATGMDP